MRSAAHLRILRKTRFGAVSATTGLRRQPHQAEAVFLSGRYRFDGTADRAGDVIVVVGPHKWHRYGT